MYINVHVNRADYFDNIYLDSITVMTADKVSETNPDVPTEDYIYRLDLTDKDYKAADLVLTPNDFIKTWETDTQAMRFSKTEMSRTLFFVYVKVRGVPDACTPCRLDEEVTLGVTFDEKIYYQAVMNLTRELNRNCEIPKDLIDLIMLKEGFDAAIETEHYIPATEYWRRLFGDRGIPALGMTKPCGCNG